MESFERLFDVNFIDLFIIGHTMLGMYSPEICTNVLTYYDLVRS